MKASAASKPFGIVLAWLVIVLICLVTWTAISIWSSERLARPIVFNDVLDRAIFGVAERPWTISLPGVVEIAVAGCRVPLNGLRGRVERDRGNVNFSPAASVGPSRPGDVMRLTLESYKNFQVETLADRVGVSTRPGSGGWGLRWEFIGEGRNEVLLLADRFWVHIAGGVVWQGVQPPASDRRVEILDATRGLPLSCDGTDQASVDTTYLTLLPPPGETGPLEFATSLDVARHTTIAGRLYQGHVSRRSSGR
jgi:hypothetical protein